MGPSASTILFDSCAKMDGIAARSHGGPAVTGPGN